MIRKRMYYAHCMAIYRTEQEKADIKTLQRLGFIVPNPNSPDAYLKEVGQRK